MADKEIGMRAMKERARELRAQGLSSSQAGRKAFREIADRRAEQERDGAQQKGRKS